jgi:hypothetical protein
MVTAIEQVDPYKARFFRRRIFRTSASWRSFNPHASFFRIRRNRKGNHVVAPPAPLGYPLFHKKTWKCCINNSETDRLLSSPLTPIPSVSVNTLNSPFLGSAFGNGGSRFHRPANLKPRPNIAQPLTALARTACRMTIGRRNRAGRSVVKPRLSLTPGKGLEAWR